MLIRTKVVVPIKGLVRSKRPIRDGDPDGPGGASRTAGALALGLALGLLAWPPLSAGHLDTAALEIRSAGSELRVELRGPAAVLVGFAHAPRSRQQRQTLDLAVQNLQTGDGLVRFNAGAGCRLEEAQIDGDHAPRGKGAAELGARYRFQCDRPAELSSAALGVFMGFPALLRAHVRYDLPGAAGEAVATPANPVVSFVPLR